jgi:hypothetical protein
MYAVEASVRTLCINVRSGLDSAFIAEMGATADAIIDSKLAEHFSWPQSPSGAYVNNPPPALVIQIANRLTASYIERTKYAINEANGQPMGNPYAASLEREAKKFLDDLVNGELVIPSLVEVNPIRQSASPQAFAEIQGTPRGISSFGRR